jgi:hypothetical protein
MDVHGYSMDIVGRVLTYYYIQPKFLYFTKYKPNPTHSIFFTK